MMYSFLSPFGGARALWAAGVLTLAGLAEAACPSVPTAERFAFNGAEVTDFRAGLVWQRCSLGQAWNGKTCTGTAGAYTHEEALAQARAANPDGVPAVWRLPNVKELSSVVDRGCKAPAVDQAAFPAHPVRFFWASSPSASNSGGAWYVAFYLGDVDYGDRSIRHHVRLVRASQ